MNLKEAHRGAEEVAWQVVSCKGRLRVDHRQFCIAYYKAMKEIMASIDRNQRLVEKSGSQSRKEIDKIPN